MNTKNKIICQNCGHYRKCLDRMVSDTLKGVGKSPAKCEDFVENNKAKELLNSPIYKKLKAKVEELEGKITAKEPNCIYQDEPLCPFCGELLDLCDWQCKCGQVLDLSSW